MKRLSTIKKLMCASLLSISLLAGCNPKPPAPSPKYTLEIENALTLSRATNSYDARDQILQNAVPKAKTIEDIRALARASNEYNVRDQILQKGLSLAQNTDDYLNLAKDSNDYGVRDQILVKGVAKCMTLDDLLRIVKSINEYDTRDKMLLSRVDLAKSVEDYKRLASATNDYGVRDQILGMAAKKFALNKTPTVDSGTVLAYEEPEKDKTGNQELPKAHAAMLKAQKAYTDAVSKGDAKKAQELNKTYQEKKKAYEALR